MNLADTVRSTARSLAAFTARGAGLTLRPYQAEAAQAVLDSIREQRGDSIVILMSRQAGKDELCANLKAYLLSRFAHREASIVEVNPTYKPQTVNAIERLERRLESNVLTRSRWRKRSDFMRLLGQARVSFLSGEAHASVVGATADLLLIINEAQDIDAAVYDKRFAPMAASTNATRLFLGTAWTSGTLLARELRLALEAERRDGRRRAFRYDADDVRRIVPAYGAFVDGEIARLGRNHPLVKTQFFNEEVDAEMGMFNPARMALMSGSQLSVGSWQPEQGHTYAFCIDVAGQDEMAAKWTDEPIVNPAGAGVLPAKSEIVNSRDSTALSIIDIDLSTLALLGGPTFRVVDRRAWTGASHLTVFGQLRALAESWQPRHIVVDATGVGEGLWAMLERAFPGRVLPVKFSASSKSDIGYRFLAIIETGRFRAFSQENEAIVNSPPADPSRPSRNMVERQYMACRAEVLIGPQHTMRWGVPDGTRDEHGERIHDDFVLADSLVAVLDRLEWSLHAPALIVPARDPLDEMSKTREPRF